MHFSYFGAFPANIKSWENCKTHGGLVATPDLGATPDPALWPDLWLRGGARAGKRSRGWPARRRRRRRRGRGPAKMEPGRDGEARRWRDGAGDAAQRGNRGDGAMAELGEL